MQNLSGNVGTAGVTSRVGGADAGTGMLSPPREERLRQERPSLSDRRRATFASATSCLAAASSSLALRSSGLSAELVTEDLWPVDEGVAGIR